MDHEYRQLNIWQEAMKVVERVYIFTKDLPAEEKYGLVSQMRRASVSIPSNISEGKMRSTGKDFRSFLFRAIASAAELQTQIEICERLGYGNKNTASQLRADLNKLMQMIRSFLSKMKL